MTGHPSGAAAAPSAAGPGPDAAPAARWRLDVAYDGRPFRGFAVQPGVPTVAGALGQALARCARLDPPPPLICAGRTDAGVHAQGQVVHVDLPDPLPAPGPGSRRRPMEGPELVRALNGQLAPSVVVRSAGPVPDGFDARRSATGRRYRYLVWNAPAPDPLLAPLTWHVPDRLDLRPMRAAADAVVGEHDFRAFCRRVPGTGPEQPIVRRVTSCTWSCVTADGLAEPGGGRLLRLDIAAGSFCHQMVRSLVGELVAVGQGRGSAATMVARLRAPDRSGAAQPAPAHGLCLVAVDYG